MSAAKRARNAKGQASRAAAATTKKYPLKKDLRNLAIFMLGTTISACGYLVFIKGNGLLAGGVWGISSIINYFLPMIPMPVFIVLINIPLLLWGWNKLNLRFALYTVFNIILQSVLLYFLEPYLPTYTNNTLLACIFGGLVGGLGGGLVVRYHGSGGGSELVGVLLKNKYDISVGVISLTINGAVVLIAGVIFGFEPAMYTMVQLYINSVVFNRVLEGMGRKRNMMIITEKGHEIAERLLREVGRGVTVMEGEGGFTRRKKEVLFCVVSRFELAAIKEIVMDADPHAFVCINETYEVMGHFLKQPHVEHIKQEEARRAMLQQATQVKPANEEHYD